MKGHVRKDSETAAAGYSCGFVIRPDHTWSGYIDGVYEDLAVLGGQVFNVHPYLPKLGGYGIRWELHRYDVERLPAAAKAALCIPEV